MLRAPAGLRKRLGGTDQSLQPMRRGGLVRRLPASRARRRRRRPRLSPHRASGSRLRSTAASRAASGTASSRSRGRRARTSLTLQTFTSEVEPADRHDRRASANRLDHSPGRRQAGGGADPEPARPVPLAARDPRWKHAGDAAPRRTPASNIPASACAATCPPASRPIRSRPTSPTASSASSIAGLPLGGVADRPAGGPVRSPLCPGRIQKGRDAGHAELACGVGRRRLRARLAGRQATALPDAGGEALSLPRHPARPARRAACSCSGSTRCDPPRRRSALRAELRAAARQPGGRRRSSSSTGRSAGGCSSAPGGSATRRSCGARPSSAAVSWAHAAELGVTRLDTYARRDARSVQRRRLCVHRVRAGPASREALCEGLGRARSSISRSPPGRRRQLRLRAAAHAHRDPGLHRLRQRRRLLAGGRCAGRGPARPGDRAQRRAERRRRSASRTRPASAPGCGSHDPGEEEGSMNRHADLSGGCDDCKPRALVAQPLFHRQAAGRARLHRRAVVLPREDPAAPPAPARDWRRLRARGPPAPEPELPGPAGDPAPRIGDRLLRPRHPGRARGDLRHHQRPRGQRAHSGAGRRRPTFCEFCLVWRECPTEEVPVLYDECGCDDTQCAPNRILEVVLARRDRRPAAASRNGPHAKAELGGPAASTSPSRSPPRSTKRTAGCLSSPGPRPRRSINTKRSISCSRRACRSDARRSTLRPRRTAPSSMSRCREPAPRIPPRSGSSAQGRAFRFRLRRP